MAKSKEITTAEWDQLVAKYFPEANLMQSPQWQQVAEQLGRRTKVFYVPAGKGRSSAAARQGSVASKQGLAADKQSSAARKPGSAKPALALGIIRDAKRGRYLEIPAGPLVDWQDAGMVEQLLMQIRQYAKAERCVFVRVRPQLLDTPEHRQMLEGLGLKLAPMHLAAPNTVIIDLTQPEEQLLAKMRRQTRYEVRRADKLGLKVTSGRSAELFQEFRQVQAETAARQHFVPPNLQELQAERTAFGPDAHLYKAQTAEGEAVAYGLILTYNGEAAYFEAASTELNRKLPGAYALQWRVMRDLKAAGVQRYNLWGVAPPGQPHHRYAKVTTFKHGFGGENVDYVPAYDLVISRPRYLLDYLVENVRRKVRKLS